MGEGGLLPAILVLLVHRSDAVLLGRRCGGSRHGFVVRRRGHRPSIRLPNGIDRPGISAHHAATTVAAFDTARVARAALALAGTIGGVTP